MAFPRHVMVTLKVTFLTIVVIASFWFSSIGCHLINTEESTRIIVAASILIFMYSLMIFEIVDRTLAALIGASISVAAHDCLINFVNLEDIVGWEDLETLSVLFGMMIVVNVLSESGLFNYLAVWAYAKSDGRFWLLISALSLVTMVLSAAIDNVSTMLLMSPTLIKLSELENIDPRYILMMMVVFSNIGGSATPIGDPPNLIIVSDPQVSSIGITFSSFTAYCSPCVVLCSIVSLIYLKLVYRTKEGFRFKPLADPISVADDETSIGISTCREQELTLELELLTKLSDMINGAALRLSGNSVHLKRSLEESITDCRWQADSIRRLKSKGHVIEFPQPSRGSRLDEEAIGRLRSDNQIKSRTILRQSITVMMVTIVLFFVQSLPGFNLTLGWVSLFAGLTLLVMSSSVQMSEEPETNFSRIIYKIEWSSLVFFFGLFIVMEVMAKLGLIVFMGTQISRLVESIPAGELRSIGSISIILWSSGLASALVDNVPFTSMMVKVVGTLLAQSTSTDSTARLEPLVFALALGACMGGNGTLVGASANLVTAGISSQHGHPITFNKFFKFAAPITVITLLVSNLYLIIVFVVLGL